MKTKKLILTLTAALLLAVAPTRSFAITYDANITTIYGGGNPDGGWTENTANNFQLALRAKDTTTGATPNTSGIYYFDIGDSWNFDFSVNSDVSGLMGRNLSTPPLISYLISVDTDPTAGVSYNTYSLLLYPDNSLGNNSTVNGAGVETVQYGLYNIAQNSESPAYYPNLISAGAGTYDFILSAYNGNDLLNTVSIQVQVGSASVPDGGSTAAMLGYGLVGIVGVSQVKKKKTFLP